MVHRSPRASSGKEAKLTVWAPGPQPVLGPLSPSSGLLSPSSLDRDVHNPSTTLPRGIPQPHLNHRETLEKLILMLVGVLVIHGRRRTAGPARLPHLSPRGKRQPAVPGRGLSFSTPKGWSLRAGAHPLPVTSKGPGKASAATAACLPPILPCSLFPVGVSRPQTPGAAVLKAPWEVPLPTWRWVGPQSFWGLGGRRTSAPHAKGHH